MGVTKVWQKQQQNARVKRAARRFIVSPIVITAPKQTNGRNGLLKILRSAMSAIISANLRNAKRLTSKQQKKAETMNLPKLAGTEKQVAWAETIRMKYMDKINARRAKVSEKAANPETAERAQLQLQNMDKDVAILLSHIDARWWIDNHDWSLKDIMRIVKKSRRKRKMRRTK